MKRLIPSTILESYQKNVFSGEFVAATIFIDISGFTAMTQALMKNGQEGAEILTSIINNIFNTAIDAIYDNQGFISTFAGDAFTAIFPSEKKIVFCCYCCLQNSGSLQRDRLTEIQIWQIPALRKIGLSCCDATSGFNNFSGRHSQFQHRSGRCLLGTERGNNGVYLFR
ncbi:MAG: hypothetical protein Q7J16_10700 [Candidatus Cloacimonadales bacterium]|nr:hypothetical protein [Candidatus Cloacimonadales bacterium]